MRTSFKTTRIIVILALLGLASSAYAATLGDVARALSTGGGILQKLLWAACIVVGILLIAAAFTQFQIHRRNPKLVPLTTPVMYLILGIVAIAIPFMDTMGGFLGTKMDRLGAPAPKGNQQQQQRQQEQYVDPNDIDAPIYR